MSNIPRVADLIRDPAIRESFRAVRLGSPPTFLDGKGIDTRRRRRPSLAKLLQHDFVSTGDVIGRDEDGNFFVLTTVSQRTFQALCVAEERRADLEPQDNEDCGEEEIFGSANGPGNEEDAEQHDEPEEDDPREEDDDAGGNVDDPKFIRSPEAWGMPGEDSLGWSDNVSQAPGLLAQGVGYGDRELDESDREPNGDEGDYAAGVRA